MKVFRLGIYISGFLLTGNAFANCAPVECLQQAISTYTAASERIESLENEIRLLKQTKLDSKTVTGLTGAFIDGCPDGWSQAKDLEGRFLIGTGNNDAKNREHPNDGAKVLKNLDSGTFGGQVSNSLPKHLHSYKDRYRREHKDYTKNPRVAANGIGLGSAGTDNDNNFYMYTTDESDIEGELEPGANDLSNYPPYYVVNWCTKD